MPCLGDARWLSDSLHDRRQAARLCVGCPVFDECSSAAPKTRGFGVWAGKDRTMRLRHRALTATTQGSEF
ncbi:WhiB family transcriptional regulator [Terrabacter sp. 2TAF16]|uniref:WhiB family transcriptional regulator n=1 Tax=Terrabacter sp. 2TAF16 TaxID=3233008 RepID=UPI003F981BC5